MTETFSHAMSGHIMYGNLDDLDRDIIAELRHDSRQSNVEIAKRLNISNHTVHRRLQKLINDRTIRLITTVNAESFGFAGSLIGGIHVNRGQVGTAVEELLALTNVLTISETTGRYDILVWAIYRNPDDLYDFLVNRLGAIHSIATTEAMINLRTVKTPFQKVHIDDPRNVTELHNLQSIDRRIVEQLVIDPRLNTTELSRNLGVAWNTAHRRLDRLLREGVIRTIVRVGPAALGYRLNISFLIRIRSGEVESVASTLSTFDEILTVAICTGTWDIMATAIFRDADEMSAFIRNRMDHISGIINLETNIGLQTVRRSGY
ncbi:MAG: Lrp/AsnC family transcriptional regulator [Chloroflexi bacterium]|jgi:DNA-binding Lrp family transcriptional regulator|nr:Lrp/AsnC family transcriptional regulator [Chloroflexota bacterium]